MSLLRECVGDANSVPALRDALRRRQTIHPSTEAYIRGRDTPITRNGLRAAALLALVMGVLLLAGGTALGVRERSQARLALDHTLANRADEDASRLEAYFERARSIMLITAHNPAFADFYRVPGSRLGKVKARGAAILNAAGALRYLEQLHPPSFGEASFI